MKKHLTLFSAFILIGQLINAQTLTLTNDDKEKIVGPNGIYHIILAESAKDLDNDCCNYSDLGGSMTKITTDSIYMKLNWFAERAMIDDVNLAYNTVLRKWNNYGSFAHSDIFPYSILNRKKAKNVKRIYLQ